MIKLKHLIEGTIKDAEVKRRLPYLNDDVLMITIQKDDSFPHSNYVQVDDISSGQNHFSSNPEHMNKMGYEMPTSKELLVLPRGRYKLSDVRNKLEQSLKEDMSYNDLLKLTDKGRKARAKDVKPRSIPVSLEDGKESWNFRYKSDPSVTDKPFQGSIQFFKEIKRSDTDNVADLPCKVDCGCPDFMYRWAWNDTAQDASQVGPKSLSKCINRRPKPAYDYGEGLCKHLTALAGYLRTKIQATQKSNLFEAMSDVAKTNPNFTVEYYD